MLVRTHLKSLLIHEKCNGFNFFFRLQQLYKKIGSLHMWHLHWSDSLCSNYIGSIYETKKVVYSLMRVGVFLHQDWVVIQSKGQCWSSRDWAWVMTQCFCQDGKWKYWWHIGERIGNISQNKIQSYPTIFPCISMVLGVTRGVLSLFQTCSLYTCTHILCIKINI